MQKTSELLNQARNKRIINVFRPMEIPQLCAQSHEWLLGMEQKHVGSTVENGWGKNEQSGDGDCGKFFGTNTYFEFNDYECALLTGYICEDVSCYWL